MNRLSARNRRSRTGVGDVSASAPVFAHDARHTNRAPAGLPAALLGHQLESMQISASSDAAGPFAPPVNALFTQAFGQSLAGVEVTHGVSGWLDSLQTPAATIGHHIYLSPEVVVDPHDVFGMNVVGHELAHALAPAASPTHLVDDPTTDQGERAARQAGHDIAQHVTAHGTANASAGEVHGVPALAPAHGGTAAVHRWGTGEHKDAVDRSMTHGLPVDPAVAGLLDPERPITLGNGVQLSPGEITALMGDFYGSFDTGDDGKEHFNPQRSFQQLWNAPPEEMSRLVELVRRDAAAGRGEGEPVGEDEWEAATAGRGPDQKTYLELAEVNDSHFSAPTMEGVDNNMGVYSIFHQMALAEAAKGGEANVDMLRALESSSMHYLTDRHASGHAFEKAGVMEAGGWTETGGNLAAKIVHDDYNREGIDATNAQGATWHALGDTHWNDDDNAENRRRTAQSVHTSWGEVAEVMGGAGRSAEQIQEAGYGAYATVPQFSPERQLAAERAADNVGLLDKGALILDELSLAGPMAERWLYKNVEHPLGEAWDWTNENVLTPVAEGAQEAWNWTDENVLTPVAEGAQDAWNWTDENVIAPVGDAVQYISDNTTLDPDEIDWARTFSPWEW